MASRLNVRLSNFEHQALAAKARASGVSMSDLVRQRCLGDNNRPRIVVDSIELKAALLELKRQGNNLNQMTRLLHRSAQTPVTSRQELSECIASVAQAADAVSKLIEDSRKST